MYLFINIWPICKSLSRSSVIATNELGFAVDLRADRAYYELDESDFMDGDKLGFMLVWTKIRKGAKFGDICRFLFIVFFL